MEISRRLAFILVLTHFFGEVSTASTLLNRWHEWAFAYTVTGIRDTGTFSELSLQWQCRVSTPNSLVCLS